MMTGYSLVETEVLADTEDNTDHVLLFDMIHNSLAGTQIKAEYFLECGIWIPLWQIFLGKVTILWRSKNIPDSYKGWVNNIADILRGYVRHLMVSPTDVQPAMIFLADVFNL